MGCIANPPSIIFGGYMAKAKVSHSDDAVMIHFRGDKKSPEPSTAVIKFPGGHVEVTRCSNGEYWAHIDVVSPENITQSRLDYTYEAWAELHNVPDVPRANEIRHIAIKVANNVSNLDLDA
jgi:hypothetical protein